MSHRDGARARLRRIGVLRATCSLRDQLQAIFERENARYAGRNDLAIRRADDRRWFDTERLPKPGCRILDCEQRRLPPRGIVQRSDLTTRRPQDRIEGSAGSIGPEKVVALIDGGPVDARHIVEQATTHSGRLRTFAGKQEDHLASLARNDDARLQCGMRFTVRKGPHCGRCGLHAVRDNCQTMREVRPARTRRVDEVRQRQLGPRRDYLRILRRDGRKRGIAARRKRQTAERSLLGSGVRPGRRRFLQHHMRIRSAEPE